MIPAKLEKHVIERAVKMIFTERVVKECATLVQCPGSDDIAGQKITRAARIILGQVLRERSELLRIRSSHKQVCTVGITILRSLKRSQIFDLFLMGGARVAEIVLRLFEQYAPITQILAKIVNCSRFLRSIAPT